MNKTADIIVIGGGIAGIGAAAMMAPDAKVIVLETEDVIGSHSTGRSAAIYIRNYGNATLRALNAASEPLLQNPEMIGETSVLSPRGEMLVAREEELPELEAYLNGAEGIERLSPAEAINLFPLLREEAVAAAAIERSAQDIDVDRLFQAFARTLRHAGGEIITKAPVTALTRTGSVWHITTPQGTFEAPIVVNAAGGWADTIARMAGLKPLGLTPMRRSAALLPAPDGYDITHWPLVASASETWYAKPEAGLLMVSPADEDPVEAHDAWADDMVLAEGLDRFEQSMKMTVTRVARSWAGLRTFAPDRTPVVGFSLQAEGFFWLAGQGGYGIQTSPALSQLAADLCLGRESALGATVLEALSPARLS
jgi:D-arginine dehydrogenase